MISLRIFPPLDLPIHPGAEGLVVVCSEAHIKYRRAMFILLDQPSTRLFTMCFIQVDMFIPRRHKQSRGRVGCELECRNRVAGGARKLELNGFILLAQELGEEISNW
jgi:hypothetical protein